MSIFSRLAALLAATLMLAVGASTASAVLIPLNVAPAGASATTSIAPVTFTFLATGQVITCQASTINKNVLGNGSGTVPAGGAVYAGCANPLLGAFNLNNPVAWALQVVGELLELASDRRLLVGLEFTVPAGGLRFANPGCTFTLSGRFTLGKLFPAQPLPIVQAITPADQFVVLPLRKQTLQVDGAAGALCGAIGAVVGAQVSKAGTYVLRIGYTAIQR